VTKLLKPLKREVDVARFIRPIVVTIDPEQQRIGFHEKAAHTIYWLPIGTAYALAIRASEKKEKP